MESNGHQRGAASKFRSVIATLTALAIVVAIAAGPAHGQERSPSRRRAVKRAESRDQWYADGQRAVEAAKRLKANRGQAKNVILFVGDGMGVSTVTAARILEGQLRGESGDVLQRVVVEWLAPAPSQEGFCLGRIMEEAVAGSRQGPQDERPVNPGPHPPEIAFDHPQWRGHAATPPIQTPRTARALSRWTRSARRPGAMVPR